MCTSDFNKEKEYDPVTGLYSMYYMLSVMEHTRSYWKEKPLRSVLYFNLNKFKLYNNYYGLQEGNKCLKKIGEILKEIFQTEFVSRFADDHFVVLYEGEDAPTRIEAAHDCIEHINDHFRLQISVGIYEFTDDDVSANIACDCAKLACDEVKGDSVHYYCKYTEKLQDDLKLRKYIIDNVDHAIENGWIQIYYQPVVRTLTQKLCSMEALTRWIDPVYGFLSPGLFIPVLESNNLIYKIDLFVIKSVARHMHELQQAGRQVMPVSINLSRMDFTVFNPCEVINEQINRYNLLREWVNVEITESTMMVDPSRIRQEINCFHAAGFQVWMDDFGSGYSSLNCLKDFDFDEIKIDLGFVKNMNERSQRILKSVINMAKELGIHTLVEGVETKEQFEILRSLGCERIQGYYFGRPEPYEKMKRHLNQQSVFPESRWERAFLDKVGTFSFDTDRPMELLFATNHNLRTLYMNKSYQQWIFGDEHFEDYDIVNQMREMDVSSNYRAFHQLAESLQSIGAEDSMDIVYRGRYYRISMKVLNRDEQGHTLYYVSSTDITHDERAQVHASDYDQIMRHMLNAYDGIYVLDYKEDSMRVITSKFYLNSKVGQTLKPMTQIIEHYIKRNVYFQDQEIFRHFTQREYVVEKLKKVHVGYLSQLVRLRDMNGNYRWVTALLIVLPGQVYQMEKGIFCLRPTTIDDNGGELSLVERILNIKLNHTENQKDFLRLSSFWQSLMMQSDIKFFWKDKNRRFLGASQSFYDFYKIKDKKDLIGKTDDDVGFHTDNHEFRECEQKVLREGAVIHNNYGSNIVQGVEHKIINSKYPVYENGKIIGLIGYFIDVEKILPLATHLQQLATLDPVTGLLNPAGFYQNLIAYDEQWRLSKNAFTLAVLDIPAYDALYTGYGKDIADALMRLVAQKLQHFFGENHIIARMSSRTFVLLNRQADRKNDPQHLIDCAREVEDIHSIDGHSCTIFVYCGIGDSSETTSIYNLFNLINSRLKRITVNESEGETID